MASKRTDDRVTICAHRPAWKSDFERERARILAALAPLELPPFEIVHFGSTAVPGLDAKPIIDIMIVCDEQSEWEGFRAPLESLDYVYWADDPDPEHRFFVKGMPPYGKGRTHHVHVRSPEGAEPYLQFRDALRADPKLVAAYAGLKKALAEQFSHDREMYTDAKSVFVKSVLDRATK